MTAFHVVALIWLAVVLLYLCYCGIISRSKIRYKVTDRLGSLINPGGKLQLKRILRRNISAKEFSEGHGYIYEVFQKSYIGVYFPISWIYGKNVFYSLEQAEKYFQYVKAGRDTYLADKALKKTQKTLPRVQVIKEE